jgi:hypothetical protein
MSVVAASAGIVHVDGGCEAPYDTRESDPHVSGPYHFKDLERREASGWTALRTPAAVLGGRAGCRAWAPLLKSRPSHAPLSLTGAKDPDVTPYCSLAQNLTPMSLSQLFA